MDLKIDIPLHFHNSSPKCDTWNPPSAPKIGILNQSRKFFDWEISSNDERINKDSLLNNLYKELICRDMENKRKYKI